MWSRFCLFEEPPPDSPNPAFLGFLLVPASPEPLQEPHTAWTCRLRGGQYLAIRGSSSNMVSNTLR